MKKIVYIFLAVVLCIGLVSCSAKGTDESALTETGTAIQASSETTAIKAQKADTDKSTETEKNKNSSQKSETKKTDSKSTSNAAKKPAKKNTKAAAKSTTKSKSAVKTTKARSTSAHTTVSKNVRCSVSIECKSILDNMDDLKAGHESFVPHDGIIMSQTTVTVKNGSTAYDALKIACDKQGVVINSTNSSYGKYIVGFNNIDEKDCGSQSGWTYTVNYDTIWKSCDKYVVKNGDHINFSFVCNY